MAKLQQQTLPVFLEDATASTTYTVTYAVGEELCASEPEQEEETQEEQEERELQLCKHLGLKKRVAALQMGVSSQTELSRLVEARGHTLLRVKTVNKCWLWRARRRARNMDVDVSVHPSTENSHFRFSTLEHYLRKNWLPKDVAEHLLKQPPRYYYVLHSCRSQAVVYHVKGEFYACVAQWR